MREKSYEGVPFTNKFRGFRTLGHYSDLEYRTFAKQLKKRLDEYFLDDCYFSISTSMGPDVTVKVTTSKNGNTYDITPLGDWDRYVDATMYTSVNEWEYRVLVDMLNLLDEDIVYMKSSVSKILNAVKNNQPLDEVEDVEDDTFGEIKRRVFGHGK